MKILLQKHESCVFRKDNQNHLYVSQDQCSDYRVRQFNEQKKENKKKLKKQMKILISISFRLNNLHFAIEVLRSQLLKMFDEMFARRMN